MERLTFFGWLVTIAAAWSIIGCQPAQQPSSQASTAAKPASDDGVTAQQILVALKSVYANAQTYRDQGTLLLSYRKDRMQVQEPQRFSTAWSRDGKLAVEVFGAQLTGDGQRLDCYIYDIETGNLDGQRLVLPYQNGRVPIAQAFADPIGRVFLGGYSELPLNESDPALRDRLVPAPLGLLTNQLSCEWIDSPKQLERLQNETLDGNACYVIRSLASGMTCDLWIDQATGMLAQMSLPLRLLDPEVMAADAITELQLLARFEDAAIDVPIEPATFELKPHKNSTPVRSFVALPEALPVESIGQSADTLRLIQPDGKQVDHLHFDGKPTALLWLGGDNSYGAIGQLTQLTQKLATAKFNFGIVYSDAELTGTTAQPHLIRPELTAATASSNVPMFYDPGLAASTGLAVREIPAVVLLDGDSRVQFATSTNVKTWPTDIAAAIERIDSGDNLAAEMLGQYQQLMADYKNELAARDARSLLPAGLRTPKLDSDRTVNVGRRQKLPTRTRAALIQPKRLWRSIDFRQPGNIAATGGAQPALFVLDGTRSVVRIDANGKEQKRTAVELPDGVAVNRLRVTGNGDTRVLFSSFGKHAFVFDQQWRLIDRVPTSQNATDSQVTDVQLSLDPQGRASIFVATAKSGIWVKPLEDDRNLLRNLLPKTSVASIAAGRDDCVGLSGGRFVNASASRLSKSSVLSSRLRFERVVHGPVAGASAFFATGLSPSQQWELVAFGATDLPIAWTVPIGSQFFESLIDPIATIPTTNARQPHPNRQSVACAVACVENAVHLFDQEGAWLADVLLPATPRGIALYQSNNQTRLLVSLPNAVECWALD